MTDSYDPSSPNSFRLGQPESDCALIFVSHVRPHSDALSHVQVEMIGSGLAARCTVESLDGDSGFRLPPSKSSSTTTGEEVLEYDPQQLSSFFAEMAVEPRAWDGAKCWRSLAGELTFAASCDALGHVTIEARLSPIPWKPTWSTSVTLVYPLGDLDRLSRELRLWFEDDGRD